MIWTPDRLIAELLDAMQEKGMLLMTKAALAWKQSPSTARISVRVGFRPSSWLGQAEKKEKPASVTSPDTPAILLDDEAF